MHAPREDASMQYKSAMGHPCDAGPFVVHGVLHRPAGWLHSRDKGIVQSASQLLDRHGARQCSMVAAVSSRLREHCDTCSQHLEFLVECPRKQRKSQSLRHVCTAVTT